MKILGIDPHVTKKYGFAFIEDGKLLLSGMCTLIELDVFIRGTYSLELVAIEDQYMSANFKTAKGLSWSAGKVLGIAELADVRSEIVNVASWKAKMGAQKGTHIERVEELFGIRVGDDEASAILIAAYAEKYLKTPVVKVKKPKKKKILDKMPQIVV